MRRKAGLGRVFATGVAVVAAVALAACGSSDRDNGGGASASGGGDGDTYKIVMSNGFVSQWRTQMQNLGEAMSADNAPYRGRVDFEVVVSENSPTAQIQSLNNIIAQRPDAILINALSPTALDPVVKKACAQDIVVIYFDQVGGEECSYRLYNDYKALFTNNAEWLARTLRGRGRIIQDLGLPGSPVSQAGTEAAAEVFARYPGIEIVARYEGNYTPGPTKQAVARILTSTRNVDGVYGIAGVDGAVQAFDETNTRMVPMTNFGDTSVRLNGLIQRFKPQGLEFSMAENAPTLGGQALHLAWRVLEGEDPIDREWGFTEGADEREIFIPKVAYNTNGLPQQVEGFAETTFRDLLRIGEGLPEDALIPYSLPQSPVPADKVI